MLDQVTIEIKLNSTLTIYAMGKVTFNKTTTAEGIVDGLDGTKRLSLSIYTDTTTHQRPVTFDRELTTFEAIFGGNVTSLKFIGVVFE